MEKTRKFADAIWTNGTIYIVDAAFSRVQALAVRDGRVLDAGSNEQIEMLAGPDTQRYDLHGRTVFPGFIESHIHLQQYGESLMMLPVRDKGKEEILRMVADAAAQMKPGIWLRGGMGWNNEVWDDPSYPTREALDAAAPDNPVVLPRMDGHLIWANSCAFALAGITKDTPNPAGGEFMRTPSGDLQGCAGNAAAKMVLAAMPPDNAADRQRALLAAQEKLLSYGVTSISDMSTTMDNVRDVKQLYQNGSYRLYFSGALMNPFGSGTAPELLAYYANGPEIGLYGGRYTVRAVKMLGDGAVGAQSAALYEDYEDRPGHKGILMYSDQELRGNVEDAACKGFQIVIHAIGDRTIDQVLDTYEHVIKAHPQMDHRFRIEHFQLVRGDSCERAKQLEIVPSMQPTHAPNSAGMALRRLGEMRASHAYAVGEVLRGVGIVALGSDAPVAQPNPLDGIHSAISRTNQQMQPMGGFYMENAISREEAIRGYTIWGAYAQHREQELGSLETGKIANFTILDQDIMQCGIDKILHTIVCETVIDGETVYKTE